MITLERTSDWDVIRYCQSRNYDAWGKPLTLKQYFEREEINYKHSLCNLERDYSKQKLGDYYWVLKDSNVHSPVSDDPRLCTIVASCEILVRDAWVIDSAENEPKVKDCLSAVIGSVFTYPENRSKGYASKMLTLLVEKMQNILTGKYDFSFLYSEVGEFYSRFGFQSRHVPLVKIELNSYREEPRFPYHPLTTDFDECVAVYSSKLKNEMTTDASRDKNGKDMISFCVKPHVGTIEWFLNRSRHSAYSLAGQSKQEAANLVFGSTLETAESGFAIWLLDYRTKQATVLMLYASSFENFKKLVLICRNLVPAEFEALTFWESEIVDYDKSGVPKRKEVLSYVENELQARAGLDNSSLSAFRLLNMDIGDKGVRWICNGKSCWF